MSELQVTESGSCMEHWLPAALPSRAAASGLPCQVWCGLPHFTSAHPSGGGTA